MNFGNLLARSPRLCYTDQNRKREGGIFMSRAEELLILYEDRDCIAVNKIQGISSEDANGVTMPSLLRTYRTDHGEAPEIYPVHRLDLPTGGAMLYAKTKEAAASLSAAILNRDIGKRYLTVVSGVPDPEMGQMEDFLYHDKRQNKVFSVKHERRGAKKAILEYRVVETVEYAEQRLSLVEVNLVTGRTHQIRAQFASRKFPVYGDRRYGSKFSMPGGVIALWSHVLSFKAPCGEGRVLMSYPDTDIPWSLFGKLKRAKDDASPSESAEKTK